MNFEAIIGLELHIEIKTKSKMFSSAPVSFGSKPNTNVAPLDLAFPGTMPSVNKQAVISAIRVCKALHMNIDDELWFDRKNYFYSDLSKGYQITQERRPIGKDGFIGIKTSLGNKKIDIERLHLEEDTCKQVHHKDYTLLDYNRAGIPLVEIVTKPTLHNGEEAMRFVERIRSIVTFLGVSSGKMEEGSLRCDVNISVRPIGSQKFGTKVEIKNLNTLTNIQRAVDYEIARQEKILLSGGVVLQETRRFDETKKETILMRIKSDVVDYKCFTESNIIPIKLTKEFIDDAIKTSPELAEVRYERYRGLGLSEYTSSLLVSNKEVSDYFDNVIKDNASVTLAANWITVDIQSILKKKGIGIDKFTIVPSHLAELLILIQKGEISNKQAREIFKQMQDGDLSPKTILQKNNRKLISDESELIDIISRAINNEPRLISDYQNGKTRVVGYLVGKVMQMTKGQADPALTNELVERYLKER